MLLSVLLSSATVAAAQSIVGLGSSYAQGPGLASPIGALLQQKLVDYGSYSFSNIALSGSNLTDVPRQASEINGTADIAYLVSGGNDLNYVLCLANPTLGQCRSLISEDEYKQRYTAALDAISAKTGETSVIFAVTYIQALGPDTQCGAYTECPLTTSQVQQDSDIYTKVVNWTVTAVSDWQASHSADVRLIPMRENSAGHDVDSSSPWINGATIPSGAGGIAWHPNNAGAEAVAEYLYQSFIGC